MLSKDSINASKKNGCDFSLVKLVADLTETTFVSQQRKFI